MVLMTYFRAGIETQTQRTGLWTQQVRRGWDELRE